MPEMQSDNSPEIQYHVLQNQAETRKVCHDVVLFHWTEQKKNQKKNNKSSLQHKNLVYSFFK